MRRQAIAPAIAALALAAGCQRPPLPSPTPSPPAASASPAPAAASTLPPLRVTAKASGKVPVVIESFRPDGQRRYRLEAQRATYDNAHGLARFQQTHVVFYGEGRRLTVDAPHAVIDHRAQTVTMDGGVRAVSQDGVVLTCRRLVYSTKTDHVVGDGDVRMVSGNDVLTGGHLEGDLRLELVTVSP
ncbi:MAG TPA: LPS export ABC transporter periplasmic protein LptC [Candidatus Dormibacteraeota bacterium]|nr:LPS export ABC transporter periplasmic protein LptC [Candidatus Dormibacteraeota bacterium]